MTTNARLCITCVYYYFEVLFEKFFFSIFGVALVCMKNGMLCDFKMGKKFRNIFFQSFQVMISCVCETKRMKMYD